MSTKYIPPNMRNKRNYKSPAEIRREKEKQEAEENKKLAVTEDNFPSLTKTVTAKPTWGGKKFSELATEWKDSDDLNAAMREEDAAHVSGRYDTFVLPRFNPIRYYVDEPPPVYEEPEDTSAPLDDDGWVRVEKKLKVKREKSFEELEEEYNNEGEQDDTVWNDGPEEHETCWDSHKH